MSGKKNSKDHFRWHPSVNLIQIIRAFDRNKFQIYIMLTQVRKLYLVLANSMSNTIYAGKNKYRKRFQKNHPTTMRTQTPGKTKGERRVLANHGLKRKTLITTPCKIQLPNITSYKSANRNRRGPLQSFFNGPLGSLLKTFASNTLYCFLISIIAFSANESTLSSYFS